MPLNSVQRPRPASRDDRVPVLPSAVKSTPPGRARSPKAGAGRARGGCVCKFIAEVLESRNELAENENLGH